MSASGNTGSEQKTEFENIVGVRFETTAKEQYQARLITVDGRLFVGLSKLAYDNKKKEFVFTKKNVFMPKSVWSKFIDYLPRIQTNIAPYINSGI